MEKRNGVHQWRRRICAVALMICMVAEGTFPALADNARATTLRLSQTEGTVKVRNKNGREVSLINDMKLYNGYQVKTEMGSYAYIGLDENRAAKMDAVSQAEIRQQGKELELMLQSGNLFFNVAAPLSGEENMNIRTSTMVTGIRGTAGWVKVINDHYSEFYVLEGLVDCIVRNPVTGDEDRCLIPPGKVGKAFVYDEPVNGRRAEIILEDYTETNIPGFVLMEITGDSELRRKIEAATGFDLTLTLEQARERLAQDEAETRRKMLQILTMQEQQESQKLVDPVFKTGTTDKDSDGTMATTGRKTTTLSMPITAEVLNRHLTDSNVILNSGGAHQTLQLDHDVQIPAGGFLNMEQGVDTVVNSGRTFQVDGTYTTDGAVTNNGTINNTSMHTYTANRGMVNAGTFFNTGRAVVNESFDNQGTFQNDGTLELNGSSVNHGNLTSTGTFTANAGFVHDGSLSAAARLTLADAKINRLEITGGSCQIGAAIVTGGVVVNGGTYTMESGTVRSGDAEAAVHSIGAGSTVDIRGGQIIADSDRAYTLKCDGDSVMEIGEEVELYARELKQFMPSGVSAGIRFRNQRRYPEDPTQTELTEVNGEAAILIAEPSPDYGLRIADIWNIEENDDHLVMNIIKPLLESAENKRQILLPIYRNFQESEPFQITDAGGEKEITLNLNGSRLYSVGAATNDPGDATLMGSVTLNLRNDGYIEGSDAVASVNLIPSGEGDRALFYLEDGASLNIDQVNLYADSDIVDGAGLICAVSDAAPVSVKIEGSECIGCLTFGNPGEEPLMDGHMVANINNSTIFSNPTNSAIQIYDENVQVNLNDGTEISNEPGAGDAAADSALIYVAGRANGTELNFNGAKVIDQREGAFGALYIDWDENRDLSTIKLTGDFDLDGQDQMISHGRDSLVVKIENGTDLERENWLEENDPGLKIYQVLTDTAGISYLGLREPARMTLLPEVILSPTYVDDEDQGEDQDVDLINDLASPSDATPSDAASSDAAHAQGRPEKEEVPKATQSNAEPTETDDPAKTAIPAAGAAPTDLTDPKATESMIDPAATTGGRKGEE
ncbi:MAG: FecR domain-containing protein [Lachnospiraceae bacterium]|nr:FecR domain-containing protein [Lachnospiraceae bacterium]